MAEAKVSVKAPEAATVRNLVFGRASPRLSCLWCLRSAQRSELPWQLPVHVCRARAEPPHACNKSVVNPPPPEDPELKNSQSGLLRTEKQ